MRFLRGALYNYFPIAGTETLRLRSPIQDRMNFTIISPLRGLKLYSYIHRRFLTNFTIISPLRGLKRSTDCLKYSLFPLQLFPHCGD